MTDRPVITFLDTDRNAGEMKTSFFGPIIDNAAEAPGRGAMTELTIATGAVAPPAQASRQFSIDTEADATSDILDSIAQTNAEDGAWILIRNDTDGRDVVVNHGAGDAGQILLADSQDLTLDDTAKSLLLRREGTAWVEIARFTGAGSYARKQATVETLTAARTLTADDDGKTFLLDAVTTGAFTVTIDPVADLPNGWSVEWEMIDGGGRDLTGNRVTFDGDGTELVGIEQTFAVLTVGHRGKLVNDGTQIRVTNEDLPEVMERITATGAYTHTRPKGRQFIKDARATAGGGGGGRGSDAGESAGGGAAGSTAIMQNWDASAQATITGNVATGGAGRGTDGNGGNGQDSTMVLGATTVTAKAGNGGNGNSSAPVRGGAGQVSTNGDINTWGEAGGTGWTEQRGGNGGSSIWSGGTLGRDTTNSETAVLGAGAGGNAGTGTSGAGGAGIVQFTYGT